MRKRNHKSVCAQAVDTGRRDKLLKVRVTRDEQIAIDIAAIARQMERSAWVRHACKLQAVREAAYKPLPPLDLDPKDVAIMKTANVLTTEDTESTEEIGR